MICPWAGTELKLASCFKMVSPIGALLKIVTIQ